MILYKSEDLSNEQYHASEDFYSSSQLKDAVKDIEYFHKKYILKEVEAKHIPAFDLGTHVHSRILEPQHFDRDCAVYPGPVRSGAKWLAFAEEHAGKAVITSREVKKADNAIHAYEASPKSVALLQKGEAEVSAYGELCGINIRVRADWINFEEGYILDVKTTTGNVKDKYDLQKKFSKYSYDLSAALYLDLFKQHSPTLCKFYWTVASKDDGGFCRTYLATDEMLELGRKKYQYAIMQIKKYKKLGWTFPDYVDLLGPPAWEVQQWADDRDLI